MRRRFKSYLCSSVPSLLLGLGLVSPVSAEVFQCDHQTSAPVPALVCSDRQSTDTSHAAWVSLRKMPAWGSHAGLTIIDFCLKPEGTGKSDGASLTVFNGSPLDPKFQPEGSCKRRYCTDKKRAFAFLLNGLPFPVGWSVISFKLGIQTQSFSISCDELSDAVESNTAGGQ
ncbi:MAG: hypothetical protein RI932_1871 [Pseudomonadota bacterium]|jgi:hypothetical protein